MACFRIFIAAVAAMIVAAILIETSPARAVCSTCISLTRAEWQCLKARLDGYLKQPVDPVLASVLGCDRHQEPAPNYIRQDAPIAPLVREDGDKDTARKVFFLTKAQIACLHGAIDGLASEAGGEPIDFDLASRCLAAAR